MFSPTALAGSYTFFAQPTGYDIERGNGLMIYGKFGNKEGCSKSDQIYVKINHPQYKEIFSSVVTAMNTGQKISGYIHSCEPVTWYATTATTFQIVHAHSAISVRQ